ISSVVTTSVTLTSSAAPSGTLTIKLGGGDIQLKLKDQWRIFTGRVDPADASHITIAYDIDGKPGVIDGRLNDGDRLMLQPRAGSLVRWRSGSEYLWNMAGTPPRSATQPATTRASADD